jgi:hypothetical protein
MPFSVDRKLVDKYDLDDTISKEPGYGVVMRETEVAV